ncbi:hypothetical protein [Massilia sp. LC238]|uniref:hypothetical protein n=1 Tax=Massilia sp. LC238 TaxID=1502852 RepID=UPI0004E37986|nr:hypothetical protein [Massilia sp. LC238]KFC61953.1 hypothetical protein FG94_04993 [Massilia sp. LC238]
MEVQEYPKALYKGGDQAAEHIIVSDGKEEATKRKAGFKMIGEPETDDKPKGKGAKQPETDDKPKGDGAPAAQDDKAPE